MYASAADLQMRRHPDLWYKGRHRVEVKAEIPGDAYDLDAALDRLGYEVVDADQWGRSYRHRNNPRRTAELDEVEQSPGLVQLTLYQGDLDEAEIPQAEGELALEYNRLCVLYSARMAEAEDEIFWPSDGMGEYRAAVAGGRMGPRSAQGFDHMER